MDESKKSQPLDMIDLSILAGRASKPKEEVPKLDSSPASVDTATPEASLTRIAHSKDEALEGRIKQGHSGLELLAWVERTYKCDRAEAITHVNRVASEAAQSFRNMFNEDHVLIMAADLYNKAAMGGRTREAASMLQVLMSMVSKHSTSSSAPNVRILEYAPDIRTLDAPKKNDEP